MFNRISPTFCKCGIIWEKPCECPENILNRFSDYLYEKHNSRIFYFETFKDWIHSEFNNPESSNHDQLMQKVHNDELIQKVLNLEGIIEIGDSAYKTPYETC